MENMYEVFRFVEYGRNCRQSLDCLDGTVLIYYLQAHPQIEKARIFDWFRQIATIVGQYQKSRSGQNYRYLTPYSIIVSDDDKLMLLNPEASENEFMIKKMQQRAVREHFVRPVISRGAGESRTADLFGFGKTVQFILAYAEVAPELTRREERKLSRIIARCTGEQRRRYESFHQILKDIPEEKNGSVSFAGKRKVFFILLLVCLAGGLLFAVSQREPPEEEILAEESRGGEESGISEEKADGSAVKETPQEIQWESERQWEQQSGAARQENDDTELIDDNGEVYVKRATAFLDTCLLENTSEGNEAVLLLGTELELAAVRNLALVYEREEMTEDAIMAYGRLLEIEERSVMIESAAVKKMKLEAEQGQTAKAVLTGEEALKKLKKSQVIEALLEEYGTETEEVKEEEKDEK